ncbi:MAG: hypothetical protein COY68_01925 [Candidatus Levybacteria bacterium CG_4_10_14_0_8_um_filter_35_23]|nr:MAG: hypothetical protein COY68_01925 [Candidatus Levybacteria bacterium CG_4_10_14_0_8_um_filter_35_23]
MSDFHEPQPGKVVHVDFAGINNPTNAPKKPTTNEVLKEWKEFTDKQVHQERRISNRRFFKKAGLTVAAVGVGIGALFGIKAAVDGNTDSAAREKIKSRLTTTEVINNEAAKVFLPKRTSIDLTKVNIRTSPEVPQDDIGGGSNIVNRSKIRSIGGSELPKDAKTMYIDNAELVEGDDSNGRWFSLIDEMEDGTIGKIYINFDTNEKFGVIKRTSNEVGFIAENGNGSIPRYQQDPIIVDANTMNKVYFEIPQS